MRFLLAFACFFRLLFTGKLPARAALYLPAEAKAELAPSVPLAISRATETIASDRARAELDKASAAARAVEPKVAPMKKVDSAGLHREGALALLGLLQREGRLIDFLRESVDGHSDADIGAAVRAIHRGCKKAIDEHFVLEAVMPGDEDQAIKVPAGFDPGEVRLIGEVKGEPPFRGVLRHHGWRVTEVKFPTLTDGVDRRVVAPAEVEVTV